MNTMATRGLGDAGVIPSHRFDGRIPPFRFQISVEMSMDAVAFMTLHSFLSFHYFAVGKRRMDCEKDGGLGCACSINGDFDHTMMNPAICFHVAWNLAGTAVLFMFLGKEINGTNYRKIHSDYNSSLH